MGTAVGHTHADCVLSRFQRYDLHEMSFTLLNWYRFSAYKAMF